MEEHKDNGTTAGGQRGGDEHETGSKKQYGTPPGSIAEAVTPSTSKSRGQLRAASLGISPSAGRSKGIGNPSPSFGAGVTKVPAPIFTKLQGSSSGGMHAQNVCEPIPADSLPSIVQTLDHGTHGSYTQDSAQRLTGHSGSQAFQAYTTLQPHLVGSNGKADNNDPFDINPYVHRADEIGASHHLPGVGLLDDLLQPPGWKEGDEPIDPHEAKLLFDEERAKAKKMLKANIDEIKHLPAEDQEKRSAERDKQWNLKFRLDQLLLAERIHIYEVYQERKNKKLRGNVNKVMRTILPPAVEPQPVNAMGSVPTRLQPMYTRSDSSSPNVANAGFPRNGLYGANRGLPAGIRYLRNGSPGFLSPSLLDPSLLPGSLDAAWKIYLANQGHVVQMKANNERFMQNAFAKYRPYPSQTQISPSRFPPVTGQQAHPFFSAHNGYVHHEQIGYPSPGFPRPPPYPTSLHHENIADSRQGPPFHPQGTRCPASTIDADPHEPATRDEQHLARSSSRKPSDARPNVSQNRRVSEGQSSQIVEYEKEEVTPKKKRASRAKGEKKEPWYAAQMAAANLPSAVISTEAMQAGLDWPGNKDEAVKKKSPPKPRRRAKAIIDPKKGMVISEAAAKALISNGAVDMRPKAAAVPADTTPVVAHNPVGPSGAIDDQSVVSPPLNPTPGEANFIFRRNNQAATELTGEVMSDCADDLNDADYGRRSTRRRVPTARKMATQKKATPQSKKRKSDVPSAGNKRTRLDAHVPEDDAGDGADQNTGNAE